MLPILSGVAAGAAHAKEPVLKPPALQIVFKLAFDEERQTAPLTAHPFGKARVVLLDQLVEQCLFGAAAPIACATRYLGRSLGTNHATLPCDRDGSSFRIFGGSENCLADEFDPCFQRENEVLAWTWSAAGDTIVRDLELPGVFTIRTRTWTVLRYEPGGRATVFEWAIWERPSVPASFVIRPRLNTLELIDLSTWPEQWADAVGLYPADDSDGDGIADAADSCLQLASSDLRDTDGDGIGNVCDSDLNQDCMVNFEDLGILRSVFFTTPADSNWNPDADFDGDNAVNFSDLGVIRSLFFAPPGPSGVPNLCD